MESPNLTVSFFNENIENVNKLFQRLIYLSLLLPFIIFLAEMLGSFGSSFRYIVIMSCVVILSNLIEILLNKNPRLQKVSMYFGLICLAIIVGFASGIGIIPIFISYIFIPVLSTLYLNKKVMYFTSFIGYFVMLFSFWFRSESIIKYEPETLEIYSHLQTYVKMIIGLSMEYLFTFFVCYGLIDRSVATLSELSETLESKNKLFEQLENSTELLLIAENKQGLYNNQIQTNQLKIIEFVAEVLGSHDLFTGNHISHTRIYVVIIAEELRRQGLYSDILTDDVIQLYSTAAFLHDIGKVHIPEGILNKKGKLTPEEYDLMKTHPTEGLKLLNFLPKIEDGTFNEIAKEMAFYHHEKWDGTGYPNHLIGSEIPLAARIMAAADVLDALISHRLYKTPITLDEAMNVFQDNKGSHFEPCIADAVIRAKDKIEHVDLDFKKRENEKNASELEWWQSYYKNHKDARRN